MACKAYTKITLRGTSPLSTITNLTTNAQLTDLISLLGYIWASLESACADVQTALESSDGGLRLLEQEIIIIIIS